MKLLLRTFCFVVVLLAVSAAAPFLTSCDSGKSDAVEETAAYSGSFDPTPVATGTCEAVEVERVVDGDTILIEGDVYVRLIGIDAPESVHPDESRNTEEGVESSDFLKSILATGDTVYLEYDVERYDQYGRVLAYVWTRDISGETVGVEDVRAYMLQGVILDAGMAEAKIYEPNNKYAGFFELLSLSTLG